jgi:DNA-binding NarL/FixJ family response regulator
MAEGVLDEFKNPVTVAAGESSGASESNLSPREKELLQLLATGASNKQIAETLTISENTVKTHMQNIMEKLQLQNRSQATAYAIKKGLIKEKK